MALIVYELTGALFFGTKQANPGAADRSFQGTGSASKRVDQTKFETRTAGVPVELPGVGVTIRQSPGSRILDGL